jgi:hypothetical protein
MEVSLNFLRYTTSSVAAVTKTNSPYLSPLQSFICAASELRLLGSFGSGAYLRRETPDLLASTRRRNSHHCPPIRCRPRHSQVQAKIFCAVPAQPFSTESLKRILFAASPASAEWTELGENAAGDVFYIDFERIREHSGSVFYWRISDYLKPTEYGDLSAVLGRVRDRAPRAIRRGGGLG